MTTEFGNWHYTQLTLIITLQICLNLT